MYSLEVKTDGNWECPWDMSEADTIHALIIALYEDMKSFKDVPSVEYRIVRILNGEVMVWDEMTNGECV